MQYSEPFYLLSKKQGTTVNFWGDTTAALSVCGVTPLQCHRKNFTLLVCQLVLAQQYRMKEGTGKPKSSNSSWRTMLIRQ